MSLPLLVQRFIVPNIIMNSDVTPYKVYIGYSVSVKTNYFWSPEDPTLTVRHTKTKKNLVIRFFAHNTSPPIDYDTAIT